MCSNLKKITLLLAISWFIASPAEPGCMDNSWHLAKCNDAKEYHYVACACPCSKRKILPARGQCFDCGHVRDPRPFIIIRSRTLEKQKPYQYKRFRCKKISN